MTELTTGQIVKIVIAVLVFVVVVVGATLAINNYIVPYFIGIGPSEDTRDFTSPYYVDLAKEDNLVGILDGDGYISIKDSSGNFKETDYYFEDNVIYVQEWGGILDWVNPDSEVAVLNEEYKIVVHQDFLSEDILLENIDGGEIVGAQIFRSGGIADE